MSDEPTVAKINYVSRCLIARQTPSVMKEPDEKLLANP